jgi:hypothetical protein
MLAAAEGWALSEDLFWQIVCLLLVIGFIVTGIIHAWKGD